MTKRNKPYQWSGAHAPDFYRTTRQAFGESYQNEKPNHDWLWFVGAIVLSIVAIALVANKL